MACRKVSKAQFSRNGKIVSVDFGTVKARPVQPTLEPDEFTRKSLIEAIQGLNDLCSVCSPENDVVREAVADKAASIVEAVEVLLGGQIFITLTTKRAQAELNMH